jgi:hypothetical protein
MKKKNTTGKSLFTMRMDAETRNKLKDLAANKVFQYNNSAVVKHLICAEHLKTIKTNESN